MTTASPALPATRRAYVIEKFGKPFDQIIKLRSDLPLAPLDPHQVRIRVHSAGLNPIDHKMVEMGSVMLPKGPSRHKPQTLGMDLAGTVVELGLAASVDYKVGDAVFGFGTLACLGAFTDYAVLDATSVVRKPTNFTFNQAAGFPVIAITAYLALVKKCNIQKGARVLIIGGATACGLMSIQLAKAYGASFVAVTASPRNTELVKKHHVDQVIDYTTQKWHEVLGDNSFDIIMDCGVEPEAWSHHAKVLKKDTGVFVTIEPTNPTASFIFKFILYKINPWGELPAIDQSFSDSPIGATPKLSMTGIDAADLTVLCELAEQGKLATPIDSVYPFEQFIDALKKQHTGKNQGKIILEIIPEKA